MLFNFIFYNFCPEGVCLSSLAVLTFFLFLIHTLGLNVLRTFFSPLLLQREEGRKRDVDAREKL